MMNQSDKASTLYVFTYIICLGWTEDKKVLLLKKNRQLIYCLSHLGSPKEPNNNKNHRDTCTSTPTQCNRGQSIHCANNKSHSWETYRFIVSLHIISVKKIVNSCQCLKKEKQMLTLDSKVPQRLKTQFWI